MKKTESTQKLRFYLFILIIPLYVLLIYTSIIRSEKSKFTYNESVFEKHGDKKIVLAFRDDDISISSNAKREESVLNIFWKYNVKQTFAYIPKHWADKNVESNILSEKTYIIEALKHWSKQNKIEFALHGYTHKKSKGSNGEFDGLPYDTQLKKIADGKKITDKIFNINVNIFAPPWNAADNNTVKACLNSGIHIFSGYLGELPFDGMTFVNTNAVLFPRANPMGEGAGLKNLEYVLEYAKKCKSTTFIIVFYHSRYDFKHPENYAYLKRLLKNISNDPLIEISSIGEIAEKYKDFLPAYNQAGLNLKQAVMSLNRAKPYVLIYRKLHNIIGEDLDIDSWSNNAYHEYWRGNYKNASMLAHDIIKTCDHYIVWGRIMAILGSVAVFLLFLGAAKLSRPKTSYFYYRSFLWFSVTPFLAVGGFLNIFHPVSEIRIKEFNIITLLFVGGILIQYLIVKMLDPDRA